MKPWPEDAQDLLLGSYRELGLDPLLHGLPVSVEDNSEKPDSQRPGDWVGRRCGCDGMEVRLSSPAYKQGADIPVALAQLRGDLRAAGTGWRCMWGTIDDIFDLDFDRCPGGS